jgi:hypothetical protein
MFKFCIDWIFMKLFICFFFCLSPIFELFAQSEELSIFYFDVSEFKDENSKKDRFSHKLSSAAWKDLKQKVEEVQGNSGQVLLYVPNSISPTIDTVPDDIANFVNYGKQTSRSTSVDFSFDANVLRNEIYSRVIRSGKYLKINLYIYLPYHSANTLCSEYSPFGSFLFNELTAGSFLAEDFKIFIQVPTYIPGGLKQSRKMIYMVNWKERFDRKFQFLNTDQQFKFNIDALSY